MPPLNPPTFADGDNPDHDDLNGLLDSTVTRTAPVAGQVGVNAEGQLITVGNLELLELLQRTVVSTKRRQFRFASSVSRLTGFRFG